MPLSRINDCVLYRGGGGGRRGGFRDDDDWDDRPPRRDFGRRDDDWEDRPSRRFRDDSQERGYGGEYFYSYTSKEFGNDSAQDSRIWFNTSKQDKIQMDMNFLLADISTIANMFIYIFQRQNISCSKSNFTK